MNPNIQRLSVISAKDSRLILGLMSGTSLDGLDLALCAISGNGLTTKVTLRHFDTVPYHEGFKDAIRKVFAQTRVDFPYLTLLNHHIAGEHAKMISHFLEKYRIPASEVDLIASHGQTVMHVPDNKLHFPGTTKATLQIGDGDRIAVDTGIITISDFRQKHVAAGGEGAPLAVYGDYLLNQSRDHNVILLNIGGIANFTFIPEHQEFKDVFVSDTGPGNTLMDAWMSKYLHLPYDENGYIAARGKVHQILLQRLKAHPFFSKAFPKSTGPEDFNITYVEDALHSITGYKTITHEDIMATLAQLAAESIAEGIRHIAGGSTAGIYLSGGGAHNLVLVSRLRDLLPAFHMGVSQDTGIPGDAKEAIIFAVLANETVAGHPDTFKENALIPAVTMGKISFPR